MKMICLLFVFLGANKEPTGTEIREKESVSQLFRVPSLEKQDTWYPTLRKTVWVLEQLHDFVKVCVFTPKKKSNAILICTDSQLYSKI